MADIKHWELKCACGLLREEHKAEAPCKKYNPKPKRRIVRIIKQ